MSVSSTDSSEPETPLPPTPCSFDTRTPCSQLSRLSLINSVPTETSAELPVVQPQTARRRLRQRLWFIASFIGHVLLRLVCSAATTAAIEEVVEEEIFGYRVSYI